jgi:hypothetical protein
MVLLTLCTPPSFLLVNLLSLILSGHVLASLDLVLIGFLFLEQTFALEFDSQLAHLLLFYFI